MLRVTGVSSRHSILSHPASVHPVRLYLDHIYNPFVGFRVSHDVQMLLFVAIGYVEFCSPGREWRVTILDPETQHLRADLAFGDLNLTLREVVIISVWWRQRNAIEKESREGRESQLLHNSLDISLAAELDLKGFETA